jgi:epoxyqueuosine reductase
MKPAIQKRANELGFDDCRFTTSRPPDHAGHFRSWLAENRHGEMGYLEKSAYKRVEPHQVLAGAKTVISLAASYAWEDRESRAEARERDRQPGQTPPSGRPPSSAFRPPTSGLVARYARFNDYHGILAPRLKLLAEFVTDLGGVGTRSLWYVDTGPLLERDLAQRAGLGFIGKHANLISRRFGNWIFLAEILTTLDLEPDAPEKNHCGSCARCLAACPTWAITAPFQLDAGRCISYLTIELKGSIPLALRTAIGNRIYGCDDCLAVCPWNRFAREGSLMKEQARSDLAAPDLVDLLALDEAGFKSRFAGTPILRTKRRGLLRNVCVALGNVGDASCLSHLEKATADSEPLIAEHARWATEQIERRTRQRVTPETPSDRV